MLLLGIHASLHKRQIKVQGVSQAEGRGLDTSGGTFQAEGHNRTQRVIVFETDRTLGCLKHREHDGEL